MASTPGRPARFWSACKEFPGWMLTLLVIILTLIIGAGRYLEIVDAAPTQIDVTTAVAAATAPLETKADHEADMQRVEQAIRDIRQEVKDTRKELVDGQNRIGDAVNARLRQARQ